MTQDLSWCMHMVHLFPAYKKYNFWEELEQNYTLQNPKPLENGLEEWAGMPSLLLFLYHQDFSEVLCRKELSSPLYPCWSLRSQETLQLSPNNLFAQFNEKVLRTLCFHQHQVQQWEDGLYTWWVGHPQLISLASEAALRQCSFAFLFISARLTYCEAIAKG